MTLIREGRSLEISMELTGENGNLFTTTHGGFTAPAASVRSDVLEQVASGVAWETIVEEWEGKFTADAISEAVKLAGQAFHDQQK